MERRFGDLVCQPLVKSYVVDAYLCLAAMHALLDPRVSAQNAQRLTVDIPLKAERQWPATEKTIVLLSQPVAQQEDSNALLQLSTL